MAEIYGIFSTRDGLVRYVGQTIGDCQSRFDQHLREARYPLTALHRWFHVEWRKGFPVRCGLLTSCDDTLRHRLETEWIGKFPSLFNERKYNAWSAALMRKGPRVPSIEAYMRRHVFNVNGFRGVHYDIHKDRYFVLIYGGRSFEWMLGDEAPGLTAHQGGNIWFSDLSRALEARERHRKNQPSIYWYSDLDV